MEEPLALLFAPRTNDYGGAQKKKKFGPKKKPKSASTPAMRLISWNCRGLGRSAAARALRFLVREVNPMGIFLIETKISDDRVQSVFRRLGFSFFVSFPPVRCKGGLAFCWRPGLVFDILMFSSSILHLLIQPGGGRVDFLCSFVYEPPLWRHKETFWKELASLNSFGAHPWVCTGDFNEVVKLS